MCNRLAVGRCGLAWGSISHLNSLCCASTLFASLFQYSHTPIIDNICVCASSLHAAPVAIVAPNHDKLKALGAELGFGGSGVAALCEEPAVVAAVLSQLSGVASQYKLEKWEKIAAVKLCASPWTPESGLLTEAMKIKRHEVAKQFKTDIEKLYARVH